MNQKELLIYLTVDELQSIIEKAITRANSGTDTKSHGPRYVYTLREAAAELGCSLSTFNRWKASGKFDQAIKQIGRKVIVDIDKCIDIIGKKN